MATNPDGSIEWEFLTDTHGHSDYRCPYCWITQQQWLWGDNSTEKQGPHTEDACRREIGKAIGFTVDGIARIRGALSYI